MRILHIASGDFFSTYGGGQVYVKNVVDAMIGIGMEVGVVSGVVGCAAMIVKDYSGHPLYEIPHHVTAAHLREAIVAYRPDVIHAHSAKHIVCRVGKELGIPVVVTSHHGGILCPAGTRLNCQDQICHTQVSHADCLPCVLRNVRTGLPLWYPLMRNLPAPIYRRLGLRLRQMPFIPFITPVGIAAWQIASKHEEWSEIAADCTLMIAPCNEIAQAMSSNGLAKEKIRVIPHGIPLPPERPPFPNVVDGKVKFYYVGRISYVKGIHTLLQAFHSVDNPAIELHLIGGAGTKQESRYLTDLQKHYHSDKRIIWHGKIAPEAIYDATRNYHVSSSSSAFLEAFGLNIAEALALGKPVLATRCGGGEMQIKDGVNGWLVPTNAPAALAEKIAWIASHHEMLPAMSANCHATSIATHCRDLTAAYSEAIALNETNTH